MMMIMMIVFFKSNPTTNVHPWVTMLITTSMQNQMTIILFPSPNIPTKDSPASQEAIQ
jgi:hypothetical protein